MNPSEPIPKVTYPQDYFIRVGLVGASIAHSKSPHLHQEWFKESGIPGSYELWETQAFDSKFIEKLILQGVKGVNVTAPFKEQAAALGNEKDLAVKATGVANTLKFINGQILAFNTDAEALEKVLAGKNIRRVFVWGDGATAKTSVYVLEKMGIREIILVSRKGRIKNFPNLNFENFKKEVLKEKDAIINATPISNVKFPKIVNGRGIYVEWPYKETCAQIPPGWEVIKGEELLKIQGRKSFDIWTSKDE